jgi:RNA polymerase sigma-70 factor (ECF subfamily)
VDQAGGTELTIVYCVVPRDLAGRLHEPLRRHFHDQPGIEVIVERRGADGRAEDRRRGRAERRAATGPARRRERRRLHDDRRVSERRALTVAVAARELPRKARRHAERLTFIERVAGSSMYAEDVDARRLVALFQAGDNRAFETLYLRYFDRVYNYLRLLLNSPDAAEDGAQQVFANVFEALPRYQRRGKPFRAWLFVIARNYALDELSRHERQVLGGDELDRHREREGAEDADLDALEWISDPDLLLFVERLPLVQRQVLLLRFMLDLSHAQIAEMLGRTPEDVRGLQSRALRFLRARLNALGRGPARAERTPRMRRVADRANVIRARRFALL